jgi:UDP-glucose 4-epimerase
VVTQARVSLKQRPSTFYGATKAASENFLTAISFLKPMRVNLLRPGYTFGNPVIDGAPLESDTRFREIVRKALRNEPIKMIKNDGTQMIWAGDLARVYVALLESDENRKTYYGLGNRFVGWEAVAREAIERTGSSSELILEDQGWSANGNFWDVSDIKRDFSLEFDPWDHALEHIDYIIQQERAALEASGN